MAMGYDRMIGKGKGGGNSSPKPPGMMNGDMRKPDTMGGGMADDEIMPDTMSGEDDMMGDEYSEEQMSLAGDLMTAAKGDDPAGVLRAIHAIMDSYEMPAKPEMMSKG